MSKCSEGLVNLIPMSEEVRLWLPAAHSPMQAAQASLGGGCLFPASGEALCFVQDPPAPLQTQTQFTDAVGFQSGWLATVIPLNLVQETKQGVEGPSVEAKPVRMLS